MGDPWRIGLLLGAVANLANAAWMLVDPAGWYLYLPAAVPDTGPFNAHFVRDVGSAFAVMGLALAFGALRPCCTRSCTSPIRRRAACPRATGGSTCRASTCPRSSCSASPRWPRARRRGILHDAPAPRPRARCAPREPAGAPLRMGRRPSPRRRSGRSRPCIPRCACRPSTRPVIRSSASPSGW